MNTTEIKKELYKQKPIAKVDFERGDYIHFSTVILIDGIEEIINFEVPIYTLTGVERRSVASSESRKKAGRKTTKKLLDCVKEWNETVDGKFTLKALSEKSKVSYKTVLRRKKDINNLVN